MASRCFKCGKSIDSVKETFITAYGKCCCETCYDEYLMTDKGKVEYIIGLANGELDLNDYDADFLSHVAVCWQTYRDKLAIPINKVYEIEAKAEMMGIL